MQRLELAARIDRFGERICNGLRLVVRPLLGAVSEHIGTGDIDDALHAAFGRDFGQPFGYLFIGVIGVGLPRLGGAVNRML